MSFEIKRQRELDRSSQDIRISSHVSFLLGPSGRKAADRQEHWKDQEVPKLLMLRHADTRQPHLRSSIRLLLRKTHLRRTTARVCTLACMCIRQCAAGVSIPTNPTKLPQGLVLHQSSWQCLYKACIAPDVNCSREQHMPSACSGRPAHYPHLLSLNKCTEAGT